MIILEENLKWHLEAFASELFMCYALYFFPSLFVSAPLNANELLLPAQEAELQQLCPFTSQTCTENINFYVQTGVR